MNGFLSVLPEDLERLAPHEAVFFFRKLLWAEARKIGVPINRVHVSLWIDAPDGGIDAQVEQSAVANSGLIKLGDTGYQIKARFC